jgi:hypothetical protein
MEEMLFEAIEQKVLERSVPYQTCTAFRRALTFVEHHDRKLYEELVKQEYIEMSN